jgi:hypothetical protein
VREAEQVKEATQVLVLSRKKGRSNKRKQRGGKLDSKLKAAPRQI